MARLLYRRALAFEGLGDHEAASTAVQKAKFYAPADKLICALQNKIEDLLKA